MGKEMDSMVFRHEKLVVKNLFKEHICGPVVVAGVFSPMKGMMIGLNLEINLTEKM